LLSVTVANVPADSKALGNKPLALRFAPLHDLRVIHYWLNVPFSESIDHDSDKERGEWRDTRRTATLSRVMLCAE
jgi:hypothetical protein